MKVSIYLSLLLLITGSLFSQTDSNTYILPELKLYQKSQNGIDTCNFKWDNNKLIVYNDTIFADPVKYKYKIGLNNINKVSFRDGTYTIRGFIYGAAGGFILGFIFAMMSPADLPHGRFSNEMIKLELTLGVVFAVIGGGIGSAVGTSKPRYVDYDFDFDTKDMVKKRSKLKKVFEKWKVQEK